MNKKNGFTLVEVIATIAIISILTIIVVPKIVKFYNSSKKELFLNNAKIIIKDFDKSDILVTDKTKEHFYYSSKDNPLNTTVTNLNYCIAYDDKGYLNKIIIYDDIFYLSASTTSEVKEYTLDNISNLEKDSVLNCGMPVNVVLDYNDDSGFKDSKTVYFGYKYGGLPAKSRDNYEFLGWFTEKDKSGKSVNHESIVNIESSHTLYGKWKIKNK